eukprot:TRINITY_DN52368_c0_g1_i1.p3 TRINITY_DN52368_c0_g1~~TRINITY_DN52368_c0_g1_i1.p3  ORF type:complete len:129 (-),score=1.43 TRINITY_DN52368_c0_g1_i1:10-396(-)
MLRYLAPLMVCMLVWVIQSGPAMAHSGEPTPPVSEIRFVDGELRALDADGDKCPSESGCCKANCAPCVAPLATQQGRFEIVRRGASKICALRADCLRSIVLGLDPPVPQIGRAVQQECRDRSRMPSSA